MKRMSDAAERLNERPFHFLRSVTELSRSLRLFSELLLSRMKMSTAKERTSMMSGSRRLQQTESIISDISSGVRHKGRVISMNSMLQRSRNDFRSGGETSIIIYLLSS